MHVLQLNLLIIFFPEAMANQISYCETSSQFGRFQDKLNSIAQHIQIQIQTVFSNQSNQMAWMIKYHMDLQSCHEKCSVKQNGQQRKKVMRAFP